MATALYNFLESLWIYNAHLFVPITPLGHGHFRNRTFSVALICFFFSQKLSYWSYADWNIDIWYKEMYFSDTTESHTKPTKKPDVYYQHHKSIDMQYKKS